MMDGVTTQQTLNKHGDWRELLTPGLPYEAYAAVDLWAMYKEQQDSVVRMQQQIDQERDLLQLEARTHCAAYWEVHMQHRDEEDGSERPKFGTRVRDKKGHIEIVWMRQKVIKTRVLSEHIPKGRGPMYLMSKFRSAPQWEQRVIREIETNYGSIRIRLLALKKLELALREYSKGVAAVWSEEAIAEQERFEAASKKHREAAGAKQ